MLIQDHMTFQSSACRDLKAFREEHHKVAVVKVASSQEEGRTKEIHCDNTYLELNSFHNCVKTSVV